MAEGKINKIANFKSLFENKNEETHNSATVKLQRSASKLNIPDIFKTKAIVSEEENSNTEHPVKPNHEVIEKNTKVLTEDKVKSMKNIFEKNNSTSNMNQVEENIKDDNIENDVKSKNKVKIFKSNQKINEDTNIDEKIENETVKIFKPKITGDKIKSIKDTFERSSTTITNQLETTEIQAHSSFIDNKNEDNILKNSLKSKLNEDISNNQADNFKSINESEIIPHKISEDKVRLIKSKFEKIKTNGNKIDIEQVLDKEAENVENKEKLELSNLQSTNEDTQHVRKIEDIKTKNIGVDNVRNIKNKFEKGFSAEKSIQTPENAKNEVLEAKTINEDGNPDIKTTIKPIQDTIEVSTNEITEDKTKVIKNIFEKSSPPSISIQNDQNSETVNNFSSKCDINTEENKNKLNFPVLRQLNLNDAPKKENEQPDENFELSPRKLKSTNLTERIISQNFDFTKPKEVKLQRSLNDDSKLNLRKVQSPENRNNAIVFDFTKSDLSPKGEMKSPIGNMESKKLNLDKKEVVSEVNDELIESSKITDNNKAEIPLKDTNDEKDENFDFNESQNETKEISESLSNKVPVPRMRTKFFTKDEINTISLEDKLPDL